LTYFVRACSILVCRILPKVKLEEAHQCFLNMVKLIEKKYGPEKITPNLHLCLHICECINDYRPMYSFWCFSYERMNSLLGKLDTGKFINYHNKIPIAHKNFLYVNRFVP
jgi:DNA-binding XRE family transcriptional regulator